MSTLARPNRLRNTAAYYLAFISLGLVTAVLGPTLPGLAKNTGSTLGQISLLFTTRSFGYLLGSLQGGRLYDRLPGHGLMAGVIGLMALSLASIPAAPWLWLVALLFLLLGFSEAGLDVGGNTLLMWLHGAQVGPFMNALHFFFGLGAFLSPVIVAQAIALRGDFRWAYWAMALLVLPAAIFLLALPGPRGNGDEQVGRAKDLPWLLVGLIALFYFLYVGAEVGFGGWIYTYGLERMESLPALTGRSDNPALAAYLNSAFWGALTVGRLVSVPLAARFRPKWILSSDLIGALLSLSLLLGLPGSISGLWLGTIGLGFSLASVFPTILSFAERRIPITGRVTGLFFVGAGAGSMFLPWLMGQLIEPSGAQAIIVTVLVDLLLALLLFTQLMRFPPGAHAIQAAEGD